MVRPQEGLPAGRAGDPQYLLGVEYDVKGLFPHNVLNPFCLPQSLSVSDDLIFSLCLHFL